MSNNISISYDDLGDDTFLLRAILKKFTLEDGTPLSGAFNAMEKKEKWLSMWNGGNNPSKIKDIAKQYAKMQIKKYERKLYGVMAVTVGECRKINAPLLIDLDETEHISIDFTIFNREENAGAKRKHMRTQVLGFGEKRGYLYIV